MAILVARQYPDRMGCCKVLVVLAAFEIFVMIGGYLVKILAVLTGVYGAAAGDGSGLGGGAADDGSGAALEDLATGWAAVEWRTDWNHHVLALTAWMPIVHSVFFLQRIRYVTLDTCVAGHEKSETERQRGSHTHTHTHTHSLSLSVSLSRAPPPPPPPPRENKTKTNNQ